MIFPLLLMIAALVLMVIGLLASYGSPFASPSRAQENAILLVPIGAVVFVIAIVWMIGAMVARWLA